MVDPISLTFLTGALAGVSMAAFTQLIARGAKHFPNDPEFPVPVWVDPKRHLNFVVCGETGVGKSRLINLLCNLGAGGRTPAPCGAGQTTKLPTKYPFFDSSGRLIPNVNVVDVPGAGTTTEPTDGYIRKYGLRWMSGVVLVVGPSIKEVDVEIVNLLLQFNVPLFIVRSKLDDLVRNAIDAACERGGGDDLEPGGERGVAAETLQGERRRLLDELCADQGIASGPVDEAERKLHESIVFVLCAVRRRRHEMLARYGLVDDFDRLRDALWEGVREAYSSSSDGTQAHRAEGEEATGSSGDGDDDDDDADFAHGHHPLLPDEREAGAISLQRRQSSRLFCIG